MIQQALGTPGLQGALVAGLEPGGDKMMDGKIKPGDVVLLFNGQAVLEWGCNSCQRRKAV